MFELITPISYWILTALWLVILGLYLGKLKQTKTVDRTIAILLVILAIDAFRTVFESVYFGLYFNSQFGLIPIGIYDVLSKPALLIIPKLINVATGLVVLFLLIYRWVPREIRQREEALHNLREAKNASEKNEATLQSILDAIPDAIVFTDPERQIASVNRGMGLVFGYGIDDIVEKTTSILYESEEEYERQGQIRFNLTAEEKLEPYEVNYRRKDGSIFVGETLGTVVNSADGQLLGFIGVIKDITERKILEDQLLKLSQAVEQSPNGICITNIDVEIEYVNEAFSAVTGYSKDEVLGRNPRMLQSGDTAPETYLSMWNALKNGQDWKGEFSNRHKDKTQYTAFTHIVPMRQRDGSVTHYVSISEDITEKNRLSQELDNHRFHLEELVKERTEQLKIARDQAEIANQFKSTFMATMSHEIRTPMNGVLGMSELLKTTELNEEQREYLNVIQNSGKIMLAVINDILDYTKYSEGKLEFEQESTDYRKWLNELMLTYSLKSGNELDIQFETDEKVPQYILMDQVRLHQLLDNLLSNAVKFTNKGTISLRTKFISQIGDTIELQFEVTDTGIGMSREASSRIFSEFEQADISTTRQYGGTGLGLAICKTLVDLAGGEIWVESELGKGSTFFVKTKFKIGSKIPNDHPSKNKSHSFSDLNILVAEDNPINQLVLKKMLDRLGVNSITIVGNGQEVLELACDPISKFHLIFMDCEMPLMDGFEAAQLIRRWEEKNGKSNIAICALSAHVMPENKRKCTEAGMDYYLPKPTSINELRKICETI